MKEDFPKIVSAAEQGDEKAFEQLYKLYKDSIYQLTLSILKKPHDAEDATQQTFMKAFCRLNSLNNPNSFSLWIRRIAVNESRMLLRRRKDDLPLDDVPQEELIRIDDEELLPAAFAERRELIQQVRQAIRTLPETQQEALVLQLYHQMTIEEIAYVTEANPNTVKARLYYARRHIKAELDKDMKQLDGVALLPFAAVYLRALREELPKRQKMRGGFRQLKQQMEKHDLSVDAQIAALLPHSSGNGSRLIAKTFAFLFIGAMLTSSFVSAVSTAPDGRFGGNQQSENGQDHPVLKKPDITPVKEVEKPAAKRQEPLLPDVGNDIIEPQTAVLQQDTPSPVAPAGVDEETYVEQLSPPTSAPTAAPTAAPTQEPTESLYADVYRAYRELLEISRIDLDEYRYARGGQPEQIVLTDIYGDKLPELIYLSRSSEDPVYELMIATYTKTGAKIINRTYDIPFDSGYILYLSNGTLYSCISAPSSGTGTELTDRAYSRYVDSAALDYHYNELQDVLLMHRNYNEGIHYSLWDKGEIDEEEFAAEETELLGGADTILFAENISLLNPQVRQLIDRKPMIGMSLEKATSLLGS